LHSVDKVQQHTNNQNLTVVKFFILDIYSFFYNSFFMRYKIKFLLLIFATSTVFFSACNNQDDLITPTETSQNPAVTANTKSETVEYNNDSPVVLGRKLTNPYTVQNMQTAYQNLVAKGEIRAGLEIKTTHKYVRFLPADSTQYDALMSDSTLVLFPYPLDYELEKGGASFQASNQPTSQRLPWLYTAVSADFLFPKNVQHEVISDLYLPETLNTRESPELIDALDYEALRITDNLGDETKGSWRPTGTITTFDNIVGGQIALHGAKIRIRRWFTIDNVYTNYSGYFSSNYQFNGDVNYMIVWETNKYDIRDGYILQAYYNGPNKTGTWNLAINSGKSLRFATIHRAAYRYHFLDIGGLKRPGVWTNLKICYRDEIVTGTNWGQNWQYFSLTALGMIYGGPAGTVAGALAAGLIPNIVIYGKNSSGAYRATDDVFSTTIHELGHASHINLFSVDELQFMFVDKIIRESWANAVEWHITRIEYVMYLHNTNYDNPSVSPNSGDHMQWWTSANSHKYTPLFIDIVDNFNQQTTNKPDDNVTGYTMGGVENMLKSSYNLDDLGTNLTSNRPAAISQNQLNILINFYKTL